MVHVAEWKYKEVEKLAELAKVSPVIGIANLGGIPSPQLQEIRRKLRGKVSIKVSKNNLIRLALKKAAEGALGINELVKEVEGESALIGSKLSPFELYKELKATKTFMPARAGQVASKDIMVEAGETEFKPGAIIGELQRAGIPAGIEGGKVVIKQTKQVVEAGELVSNELAQALKRLEINPVEVGLDLRAVWENGILFKPSVLEIDRERVINQIHQAFSSAFNLALNQRIINKFTIQHFIQKASREAKICAVEAKIFNKETIPILIRKAYLRSLALKVLRK
jgi:large subunit ribosomal protein L10